MNISFGHFRILGRPDISSSAVETDTEPPCDPGNHSTRIRVGNRRHCDVDVHVLDIATECHVIHHHVNSQLGVGQRGLEVAGELWIDPPFVSLTRHGAPIASAGTHAIGAAWATNAA
ncbi:hypothetical protein [Streptomyces sp. NPDC057909]|uniref:hypothetical protein n=1 Tax=Streptomyces sp. NPDC057909 TaxID=3346277 RepID=UPI0036E63301